MRSRLTVIAWSLVSAAVVFAVATVSIRSRNVGGMQAATLAAQAMAGPLFAAVGAVIVARRPRHIMGWFFAVLGTVAALDELLRGIVEQQPLPSTEAWMPVVLLTSDVLGGNTWMAFGAFLPLLFPDGRVPSRRWRPVLWSGIGLAVIVTLASVLMPGAMRVWKPALEDHVVAFHRNPLGVSIGWLDLAAVQDIVEPLALLYVLAGLCALVVRWRRDPVTRQQIKWILLGFGLALSGIVITAIPGLESIGDLVSSLAYAALPITMGIAITRYRLFEVDRLLSRTVSYLVVVVVLVGLYAGSVIGLSAVARAVTGESGDLVVALSTLAVAAAFQPLRRRVQTVVDRRFNRARYDANRTLDTFGRSLRNELDGQAIAAALGRAASRSLQPQGLSVLLTTRSG